MVTDIEERPAPRRNGFRAWVVDRDWILALSLAAAVGVGVWFGRAIKDFFSPAAASISVPSLVGQIESDANGQAARLHLKPVVIARRVSERFPKDVVMEQQPSPGSRVREGRQVSLIVSRGVNIFSMPDLRFQSLRNAGLELSRRKLQLGKQKSVPNDEVPANHVVAQDPAPLSSVREGTPVNLTLSKGPPQSVRVPNFVNGDIEHAREDAARARVHIGQIVWTSFGLSGPPRGRVVRQSPGGGQSIDPFAPVSLQVSAGPTQYGYLIRQVHASATVPHDDADQSKSVRIEVRDETGVWNVYNSFAQPGQRLDFNLTVVGSASMLTYINNELLNQTTLGKEAPLPVPVAPPSHKPEKAPATP